MTEPGGQLRADLVLEGGGVKGIGLVGALSVLEEAGYRFERVAGTSAGSIVGSLVAAGMTLGGDVRRDDGARLSPVPRRHAAHAHPGARPVLSLFVHEGVYEGRYVESFVADRLREKGVTTWADLRRDDPGSSLPPDHRYKLVVHVSDVTESALLRLPWVYESRFGIAPDTESVAGAVRASSSIPFFFRPTKLKRPGGETSWLVDGGMLSNFPIDVFDRTDGEPSRWPTIGIKLSAEKSPGTGGRKVNGLDLVGQGARRHPDELVRPHAHQRSRRGQAHDLRRHHRCPRRPTSGSRSASRTSSTRTDASPPPRGSPSRRPPPSSRRSVGGRGIPIVNLRRRRRARPVRRRGPGRIASRRRRPVTS